MTNRSLDRKATSSVVDAVIRSSGTIASGRLLSRLMTMAGVVIVLVYWRQTGGW